MSHRLSPGAWWSPAAQIKSAQNLGIYRQQVIAPNKVIMRWLAHRGGALDFRDYSKPIRASRFPVAVALGADPATILGAVTPVPDSFPNTSLPAYCAAHRPKWLKCLGSDLQVPPPPKSSSKALSIPARRRPKALTATIPAITTRWRNSRFSPSSASPCADPIYHSTYTGKPPDEPAILGVALNEVFVPLLQKQFPEIVDFYLPPEGCSYRLAVVSIKKQYPATPSA